MDEDEIVEPVRQEAALESAAAVRDVTEATPYTLGGRITDGEASDLARALPDEFTEVLVEGPPGEAEPFPLEEFADRACYLPDDLAPALDRPADEDAEGYSIDEFAARVAQREGVEKEPARVHAHAVCNAPADATSERELDAARKQLPDRFGAVFDPPTEADRGGKGR